jgi:hypothetical protein
MSRLDGFNSTRRVRTPCQKGLELPQSVISLPKKRAAGKELASFDAQDAENRFLAEPVE